MSKKITELPVAAAITGTEVLPVVQGGVTKNTSINGLLAKTRNPIVSDIVRDSDGRFQSYTEDGVVISVTRDELKRVATITEGEVTRTVSRDPVTGRVTGIA